MPAWLAELRQQFPITERMTYFDIAYDNSGGLFLRQAAEQFYDDWLKHIGEAKSGKAGRDYLYAKADAVRAQAAELLGGVEADHIAFTRNTNEAFNLIAQSYPWQSGDNIVLNDIGHVSVNMPFLNLKRQGVDVRFSQSPDGVAVTVDSVWERVDEHTRLIALCHVQAKSGYKLDLEELGRRCRERGIFLVVDAIQSLGIQRCDAKAWGLSAVSAATYKGLLGSTSCGIFYCEDRLLRLLQPAYVGATDVLHIEGAGDAAELICSDPGSIRKLENGTLNFMEIYALHESLRRILGIGQAEIEAHVESLFVSIYEGMSALGFRCVTPREPERHCGILAFECEHLSEVAAYFASRGFAFSHSGYLRFSVAPFNNEEDVAKLLAAAKDCPLR